MIDERSVNGVYLTPKRRCALDVPILSMECDAQEIPASRDAGKPVGWWLAGVGKYEGEAATKVVDWQLMEPQSVTCEGTLALAVTAERVMGIVSPDDVTALAVWWSWDLEGLEIETAGEQGLLGKRPKTIRLLGNEGEVELTEVSRLYRNSGSHRTGQEGSLLKALA